MATNLELSLTTCTTLRAVATFTPPPRQHKAECTLPALTLLLARLACLPTLPRQECESRVDTQMQSVVTSMSDFTWLNEALDQLFLARKCMTYRWGHGGRDVGEWAEAGLSWGQRVLRAALMRACCAVHVSEGVLLQL